MAQQLDANAQVPGGLEALEAVAAAQAEGEVGTGVDVRGDDLADYRQADLVLDVDGNLQKVLGGVLEVVPQRS